jgi:hypothetical protein
MEPAKTVEVVCTNLRRETMQAAKLTLNFGGKEENFIVPDLAAGKSFTAKYTVNTALKPERYVMRAKFSIGDYATEQTAAFEIVPRLAPRMPVVMWGANAEEMDRLKDIGFTHFIGLGADAGEIWTQKKVVPPGKPEVIERNRRHLDEALAKAGDHVAIIGDNRKLLIFPLSKVPEMSKGRGVILQRYQDGGCADAKVFTLKAGLTWMSGNGERVETALKEWIGQRAQAGRLPMKGFTRDERPFSG